jgi:hypothetical protein
MQYVLQPEVPGELGDHTIMNTNVHPPIVEYLHFTFFGWLGDDLVECFPCFLVSDRLKQLLNRSDLKGFYFADCEIDSSEEFELLQPQVKLPVFTWLKVSNSASDDFFINSLFNLQVSEKAWAVLNNVNVSHCDVSLIE